MQISDLLTERINNIADLAQIFNTKIHELSYTDEASINECRTLLNNILYRFSSFSTLRNELAEATATEPAAVDTLE